jgi:SAM-dependent methyltransferase
MTAYEPTSYWNELLAGDFDESAVGYAGLARSLNLAMYRSTERSVIRALRQAGVQPAGSRVLDIGSGTGWWIEFWRARGAREIAGVDLTATSVERLRARWPMHQFAQVDVGDQAAELPGENDVVSAMSVLLHIVDEERFHRALAHLAASLRLGGALVMIEPVVVHHWWGAPFGPEASSKARALADYREALQAAGLELCVLLPATVLLANVIDTRSRLAFRVLEQYWVQLRRVVGKREPLGKPLARVLQPLDALAIRLAKTGPSAKVLVARRVR